MILLLVLWVGSGIVGYGLTFGYFQNRWPEFAWKGRVGDRFFATYMALLGPIGAILAFILSNYGEHGLRWRGVSREDSITAHLSRWPMLPISWR